ncbi:MAG: cellulase family glycosylhydrolase [bacterium]|nr:cellulase family glycosylhydrolase [bacterium]
MAWTGVLAGVVLGLAGAALAEEGGLPRLHTDGRWWVDESGQRVELKGCNLGNWLLLEPWMLGLEDAQFRDQHEILSTLVRRFGTDRAEALLDVYRANWITAREFEFVSSFGFNVVRVPFHHALLATDERPFDLRTDAFEWLDRAVELAEQAGVYVILDMHGVPGGQSTGMPSGRVGENDLWGSEAYQKRTAWLWQRIAERYRGRSSVVAYDLINEPWGDSRTDVREELVVIVERIIRAIREVDPDKLCFAPGSLRGFKFYGHPRQRGWNAVGFTEHFYPGLFGNGAPSLETHARFLGHNLAAKRGLVSQLDVPYLVGEFNVVFDYSAQPELMRRYFDDFAASGWAATMWALRTLHAEGGVHPDNWYLVTNAKPFVLPDLHTAAYDEIEQAFRALGTMELAADEKLRAALTAPRTTPLQLAKAGAVIPPGAASTDRISGWGHADVGGAQPGGGRQDDLGRITVWGGGGDIWGNFDAFHFAHKPAGDEFETSAWLRSFEPPHHHAKAGWMLRESTAPDAAHVLVHAFPDGRVMLGWRDRRGGIMQERCLGVMGFPVGLGLERKGGSLYVRFAGAEGTWRREAVPRIESLETGGLLGLAILAHDELLLASATFWGINQPFHPVGEAPRTERDRLRNGSFEVAGDAEHARDQARDWKRWGAWFNREDGWTPRADGRCVLGYHHWRLGSTDSSGTYQDVSGLVPGTGYTFTVQANRDLPADGKHGPESIELRIESPHEGRLLRVASQTYRFEDLASGDAWSTLRVAGTIPTDQARVLIIVYPSRETPRDAALKFDRASLRTKSAEGTVSSLSLSLSNLEAESWTVASGEVGAVP